MKASSASRAATAKSAGRHNNSKAQFAASPTLERMTERQLSEFEHVLAADNPLEALWKFQSGWTQSALGVEFLALTNHRKSIRDVLADTTDRARAVQTEALASMSGNSVISSEILPSIA